MEFFCSIILIWWSPKIYPYINSYLTLIYECLDLNIPILPVIAMIYIKRKQPPISTRSGFDCTSESLELLHSQKKNLDHKTYSAPAKRTAAKSDLSMGDLVSLCMNYVPKMTPRASLHTELTEIRRLIWLFTQYLTKDDVTAMDRSDLEAVQLFPL